MQWLCWGGDKLKENKIMKWGVGTRAREYTRQKVAYCCATRDDINGVLFLKTIYTSTMCLRRSLKENTQVTINSPS